MWFSLRTDEATPNNNIHLDLVPLQPHIILSNTPSSHINNRNAMIHCIPIRKIVFFYSVSQSFWHKSSWSRIFDLKWHCQTPSCKWSWGRWLYNRSLNWKYIFKYVRYTTMKLTDNRIIFSGRIYFFCINWRDMWGKQSNEIGG